MFNATLSWRLCNAAVDLLCRRSTCFKSQGRILCCRFMFPRDVVACTALIVLDPARLVARLENYATVARHRSLAPW